MYAIPLRSSRNDDWRETNAMTGIEDLLDLSSLSGIRLQVDDEVLMVELNRPDRLNALSRAMVSSMTRLWSKLGDTDIRVVVITGTGRGFCAGADLRDSTTTVDRPVGLRYSSNPHVLALANLRQVVIAAVNGPAAGAGLALACAADIRVGSTAAKFIPAFGKAGLVPDAGASYFIPRIVGYGRAVEWLLSGSEVGAAQAMEWGLVSAVVPPDELLSEATSRARSLAAMPPTALGLTKALLQTSTYRSLADQLESEAAQQLFALAAPERAEARAATVARISSPERQQTVQPGLEQRGAV